MIRFIIKHTYTVKIRKYPAGGANFFHPGPDFPIGTGCGSDAAGSLGIPPPHVQPSWKQGCGCLCLEQKNGLQERATATISSAIGHEFYRYNGANPVDRLGNPSLYCRSKGEPAEEEAPPPCRERPL